MQHTSFASFPPSAAAMRDVLSVERSIARTARELEQRKSTALTGAVTASLLALAALWIFLLGPFTWSGLAGWLAAAGVLALVALAALSTLSWTHWAVGSQSYLFRVNRVLVKFGLRIEEEDKEQEEEETQWRVRKL